MEERVILVDQLDNEIGTEEKLKAHQDNLLHRALSVFILDSKGQMLLQQRALSKYHSPGLWTNTCCSHPRPGETTLDAANRRLQEEMGMSADLTNAYDFTYQHKFDNGLWEYEYDHVFIGRTDVIPKINTNEVHAYQYVSLQTLNQLISDHPESFTVWFKLALPKLLAYLGES